MDSQDLTLQELADRCGIEPRTIRSYVQQGIIPGPEARGRAARYPPESLARLKLFALLRDAHRELSVDAIRRLIDGLAPAAIGDLAEGRRPIADVIPPSVVEKMAAKGSALLFLQSLGEHPHTTPSIGSPPRHGGHAHAPPPPPSVRSKADAGSLSDIDLPRLERAAQALADLVGVASARSSRGTNWYRIPLTRDIELSVRGDVPPEQLAWIHRIADSLRLLLTKGAKP
jgi:transcriptional regulator with XRE-family HTH domain